MKYTIFITLLFTTAFSIPTDKSEVSPVLVDRDQNVGNPANPDLQITIYRTSDCQSQTFIWTHVKDSVNMPWEGGFRGFKLSRALNPGEQLDFSTTPTGAGTSSGVQPNGAPAPPSGPEKRGLSAGGYNGPSCDSFQAGVNASTPSDHQGCFGLGAVAQCACFWMH